MAILLQQLFALTIALHFAWCLRLRRDAVPNALKSDKNKDYNKIKSTEIEMEVKKASIEVSKRDLAPSMIVVQNPSTIFHRAAAPKVASKVPVSLRHTSQIAQNQSSDKLNEAITAVVPSAQLGTRRRWEHVLAHLPASIVNFAPIDEDSDDEDGEFA